MVVDLKQKSQVTIPKAILNKLHLKVGDMFDVKLTDGNIVLTPVDIIPKAQTWYYSKEWQIKEHNVDKQIIDGNINTAKSKEELIKGLGLENL